MALQAYATNPYAGQPYTGRMDVSYEETENGTPPDISIKTDRFSIRPLRESDAVVQFFKDHTLGSRIGMAKNADMRPRTHEEVVKRVHIFADRWMKKDHGSALLIMDRTTGDMMGYTVFGHGDNPGEAEFALMIRPHYPDGSSAWNNGIGKEVTYAMYQGLMPLYAERKVEVINDTTGQSHPVAFLLATSRRDNEASYKILSRLHETDPVHRARTHESEAWGAIRTHFYTTPENMRAAREALLKKNMSLI